MKTVEKTSFQERSVGRSCFGCGADNDRGLRIKSYWSEENPAEAVCNFYPEPHMNAGMPDVLNGGVVATIIDCHGICTAVAEAYRREGREHGSEPPLWYVTGEMTVRYLKPAPIEGPIHLSARVREAGERRSIVDVTLSAKGETCATGVVTAIRLREKADSDQ